MKILVTGAHFTPAQAVIEELRNSPSLEEKSPMDIVYIGRNTTMEGDKTPSMESQILPKLGVKFYPIIAGRLRRHSPDLNSIMSILKIPVGFLQAAYILLKEKPAMVLSFGGYVSLPVVIDAWFLSIPIIAHEQTLVTGLANKINSFFANKILVSYDTKYNFPKDKLVLTGNPIRKELIAGQADDTENVLAVKTIVKLAKKEKLPVLYITGGNQGSHVINKTVEKILNDLTKKMVVIHQTGDSKYHDFDKLLAEKNNLQKRERYLVQKWFNVNEVGFIFRNADLAISRAGANILAELGFFAIPTLVIPIPYLYQDEQGENARFFQKTGLVKILPQPTLSAETLFKNITMMLKDIESLKKSAQNAKQFIIKDAAKKIAQEVLCLI